jgi:hypothetical protein
MRRFWSPPNSLTVGTEQTCDEKNPLPAAAVDRAPLWPKPSSLVPFKDIRSWKQFDGDLGEDTAKEIREYFLPDFSERKTDHNSYLLSFEKVLTAFRSAE